MLTLCSYIYEYGNNASEVNIPDATLRAVRTLLFSLLLYVLKHTTLYFTNEAAFQKCIGAQQLAAAVASLQRSLQACCLRTGCLSMFWWSFLQTRDHRPNYEIQSVADYR